MANPDEARAWRAVGRLNLAGRGFCTATLVAPDLIATAAHCLRHPVSGRALAPERLHFLLGHDRGRHAAYRRGRAALSPPGASGRAEDVAVVVLDAAVDEAPPLALGPLSAATSPLALTVGYGVDRPEALSIQHGCRILARRGALMRIGCAAPPGSSGAPLIARGAAGPFLAGVIVARGPDGHALAVAAEALAPLIARARAMEAGR
ncbi:trypsin-like serine peptidase [Oceanicella actignis]|nr:trypsin-like peptidase domain-containing protein [Oceanicella actignis]